ncbi:DsbA family protein [Burkholderia cenocepacia]|uniref:DsbA family protein n=1 Tax=Burkholderia cenocepacia TaxID=95486 RepID=UPI001B958090|nr:DsbA family protein [Burkholderia cenocepacia]MBR7981704.1 DsbA family protein [Burkholderia cenocepacia]
MSKILHYVFDPLCGWCYGASGALTALADRTDVALHLLPSGLFAGEGARPMNDEFAAYAWSNDQRIEQLTGQSFTERYRSDVLADHQQMFDSGPATIALTAVALTAPERETQALKAIQLARYVDGQDVTQINTLVTLLSDLGLEQAAARLARPDTELIDANRNRVAHAQALLQQFGARGVPSFILESEGHQQLLHASAAFSNPQAFVAQLAST